MSELVPGSTYALEIVAATDEFPAGSTYEGEVRRAASDAEPLLTLSSAAGTVVRETARKLVVLFPGEDTADWRMPDVLFQLWRTDLAEPLVWTPVIRVFVQPSVARRPSP